MKHTEDFEQETVRQQQAILLRALNKSRASFEAYWKTASPFWDAQVFTPEGDFLFHRKRREYEENELALRQALEILPEIYHGELLARHEKEKEKLTSSFENLEKFVNAARSMEVMVTVVARCDKRLVTFALPLTRLKRSQFSNTVSKIVMEGLSGNLTASSWRFYHVAQFRGYTQEFRFFSLQIRERGKERIEDALGKLLLSALSTHPLFQYTTLTIDVASVPRLLFRTFDP